MQEPLSIKLVVVGDGAVGKTCVLISYSRNEFPTDYVPTVFDSYTTTIKIDGKTVNLGLWDTAGQEQYNRLRPLAYPNADVFLIIFSVIEPTSFTNAIKQWYPQVQGVVPNAPKIFVGNKIDQREQYALTNKDAKTAPIQAADARKVVVDQMGCKYVQCSALTQQGLKNVFDQAMRAVLGKPVIKKKESESQGKSGCNLI